MGMAKTVLGSVAASTWNPTDGTSQDLLVRTRPASQRRSWRSLANMNPRETSRFYGRACNVGAECLAQDDSM